MSILLSTFVVLVGAGWKSVGGQLLTSGVLLLSGYQDVEPRARISASFWFFMALAFCISALVSALSGKLWGGAAMSLVFFASKVG